MCTECNEELKKCDGCCHDCFCEKPNLNEVLLSDDELYCELTNEEEISFKH